MFVNDDYSNYKYLVSISDNYVCLTNQRTVNADWQNPRSIDVIYQYLKPSFVTIESSRTYTSSTSFEPIDISNSFYARADCLDIIKVQFIIGFFVIFILNALTRFIRKGGIFFGQ